VVPTAAQSTVASPQSTVAPPSALDQIDVIFGPSFHGSELTAAEIVSYIEEAFDVPNGTSINTAEKLLLVIGVEFEPLAPTGKTCAELLTEANENELKGFL
jgi:hypothetical protein